MDSVAQVLLVMFGGITAAAALLGLIIATASKPIRRIESSLQETEKRLNIRLDALHKDMSVLSRIAHEQAELRKGQQLIISSLEGVLPSKVHRVVSAATAARDNIIYMDQNR